MKKKPDDSSLYPGKRVSNILLKMKLFTLLIFAGTMAFSANTYSQKTMIDLQIENLSLTDILNSIEKKTEFRFIYNASVVNSKEKKSISVSQESIENILSYLLTGTDIAYKIDDTQVFLFKNEYGLQIDPSVIGTTQPQKRIISGKVTDEKGDAIPGANIVEKGTTNGIITDQTGNFKLVPTTNNPVLVFSFIGMNTQEIKITGQSAYNVVLIEAKKQIEELVVTGYYEKSKQTFTGATSSYTGEELRMITNNNVLAALSVIDPSFNLIENNNMGSDPNTLPDFQLRGATNIISTLEDKFKNNPNTPIFMLDGFQVSLQKIIDLDPSRIRSTTVLKDAAALALYGSRGSNGVVVITTNAPEAGSLKVSYNGSINFEAADLSDYHLLNATDKLEYEVLAGLFRQNDYIITKDKLSDWYNQKLSLVLQGINTDWITKPVKKLGTDLKHSIGVEGGDDKFRYKMELDYNPQTGVMKGSERNRMGIGIKLQYNYKNLSIKNALSFDNVKSQNSPYGNFSTYAYLNPYYYPFDENGDIRKIMYTLQTSSSSTTITNPLYNATINTKDESRTDNFTNNFNAEWRFSPGFKLTANFAIEKGTTMADVFKPSDHTDFIGLPDLAGSYKKTTAETFSYEGNLGISYIKSIRKNLLVVNTNYNIREEKYDAYNVTAFGFPNELMDNIGMGLKYQDGTRPSGSQTISRLMGFLGNVNYSYDTKYFADFAFRYDGSSQFGSNKRWGGFWSSGLGWNLHKEAFLAKSDIVNLLKMRCSIGYTGGQNYYPYQALLMYQYSNTLAYTNYIGAYPIAFGNPDLKWQRTLKQNYGADFSLFKERLTGALNYYTEESKDVLVDVTLAPSLGFDSFKSNLGEVQNRGFDLTLQGKLYANEAKKINWMVFGSLAHNTNRLMKISDALQAFNRKADANVTNKPVVRFIEGQSMNTIWAVESLGIDPATGNEVFRDINGNLTNKWSVNDYKALGTTDPILRGMAGTSYKYRSLQFSLNFQYRLGGDIYNSTLVNKVENVDPYKNVDSRVLTSRWKKPGDNARFKNISDRTTTYPTSRFIVKENLVELKSVNITYTVNPKKLAGTGLSQMRITAYLNDVFRISSVKAERGINYPFAKHYALALQLTF